MRTAIVTGGAQGIGKGIVEHLIAEGWRVAALDKDSEAVAELSARVPVAELLALSTDVSSQSDVAKAFKAVANWNEQAGGRPGWTCWSPTLASPIRSADPSRIWIWRAGVCGRTAM